MSSGKLTFANDWLAGLVETDADAPALIDHNGCLGFSALQQRIERKVLVLQQRGLQGGCVVALMMHERSATAVLVLALQQLGCTPFPLNPDLPAAQLEQLLSSAKVQLVISESAGTPVPAACSQITLRQLLGAEVPPLIPHQKVMYQGPDRREAFVARENPALILATSGSSAVPKGVMLSAENLAFSAWAVRQRIGLERGDCWLCCLPLYHIGGLAIVFRCLQAGATLFVQQRFSAPDAWQELLNGRITHLSLVPAMLRQLLQAAMGMRPPPSLRVVIIGGSAIDGGLLARALAQGWPLCLSYGMTETASQLATCCLGEGDAVGQRAPGGELLVGVEVRAAACGEGRGGVPLRVRGPMVMMGYVNPGLEPGHGLREGWLETHDLGCLDAHGRLVIQGRADAVILSGGENIQPQQVEELILTCEGVEAVAVAGRADAVWGEVVVALYCGSIAPAELEVWCRAQLPRHWRPRAFSRVAALPQTALGKLDRQALTRMLNEFA